METRHYWEENGHAVKYENYNSNDGFVRAPEQLNFATAPSEDEGDYPAAGYLKKGKVSRQDPMSHRIIEKRRRDRMNNCLADLSRLIPPEYLKKGRGRVEKTEIIEMAIRHIKYLQERANGLYHTNKGEPEYAAEKPTAVVEPAEHYKAGFQEAVAEAVRFLVEVQNYGPGDGLCVQLSSHLQRHYDHITNGEPRPTRHAATSETTSPSSSTTYVKAPVIARAPELRYSDNYEPAAEPPYSMECDRVSTEALSLAAEDSETQQMNGEPLPLDVRQKTEPNLRAVRKPEFTEEFLQSYKFKNSIERRFSRSQDCEVHDMSMSSARNVGGGKAYSHKRRRAAKPTPSTSTSTSNSGSTEDARDTSPQDTSSESPHHHYEKPAPPSTQLVPVFALNALGKYYVPLSIDYACLSRHLGPYVLDARTAHLAAPLHPVTIHVNFQPCMNYHVKREPNNCDWRAM